MLVLNPFVTHSSEKRNNAVRLARSALIIALVACVDGFQTGSVRMLVPTLRSSKSISLRQRTKASQSLLGLRATATSPINQALEKSFAEPAVPNCREKMYDIAQASNRS